MKIVKVNEENIIDHERIEAICQFIDANFHMASNKIAKYWGVPDALINSLIRGDVYKYISQKYNFSKIRDYKNLPDEMKSFAVSIYRKNSNLKLLKSRLNMSLDETYHMLLETNELLYDEKERLHEQYKSTYNCRKYYMNDSTIKGFMYKLTENEIKKIGYLMSINHHSSVNIRSICPILMKASNKAISYLISNIKNRRLAFQLLRIFDFDHTVTIKNCDGCDTVIIDDNFIENLNTGFYFERKLLDVEQAHIGRWDGPEIQELDTEERTKTKQRMNHHAYKYRPKQQLVVFDRKETNVIDTALPQDVLDMFHTMLDEIKQKEEK